MAAREDTQLAERVRDYGEPVRDLSTFELFDTALETLEKQLDILAGRLGPVSHQYATASRLAEPRPEPSSQFRARIERLAGLNEVLGSLIANLDL